jgi:hypothetical protein
VDDFQTAWIALLGILLLAFLGIGVWINRRPLGILIDDRYKMTVGRLQLVLWSWILISAFFAVAITRKTMDIELPSQIWALMGISVGSTAAGVIIKGTKAGEQPAAANFVALNEEKRRGVLSKNADCKLATLSDLFKGEELTDWNSIDISKVQMFFFTLATVIGYAVALWSPALWPHSDADHAVHFPEMSTSLVTLLGISHAGYLTVKAAPKTPTA